MRLKYLNKNGQQAFVELSNKPVVIGRSSEADIILGDERISRLHCGVRIDDGVCTIKDLGSRNGTFVNAEPINSPTLLQPGDHIRVGDTVLTVEQRLKKENATILHEIQEEMDQGKGYNTILHEIVDSAECEKV